MREEPKGPDGLDAAQRCVRIENEPLPQNLNALLDEAVDACGDKPLWSFIDDGITQSYAEVQQDVIAAAKALQLWGVTTGMPVAVMLPNIPEYPILWLALARIGAVIVPINIRYSPREVDYVVTRSGARRLVISADLSPLLDRAERRFLEDRNISIVGGRNDRFSSWADQLTRSSQDKLETIEIGPDDLLNIQFTSGTTGFPKGCELTHRYWLISGKVNAFRDGRAYQRIWASTPFSYMDPHWLLIMTLYQRATLYVARRQSASRFMGWMRKYRINFCLLPALVLKEPPHPEDRDNAIVRANVYGLSSRAKARIHERFGIVAREAFGMTEIGSGLFVPIEAADKSEAGSCGRASPFRRLRIVDSDGKDVAEGDIGELLVSGAGIMRAYADDARATREAFFGEWFRTGDLFRRDQDGYYYLEGRKKDMIRRSGENISAREIEYVLRDLQSVYDVAAVSVPDERRGEEVKVIIVLTDHRQERSEAVDRILSHCQQNLAVFKIPRFIEFIGELPRTNSGKVAKGDLRYTERAEGSMIYDRETNSWS